MNDIDPVEGDVQSASPRHTCSNCGKRLSRFNKTGRCFHHPDLAQVRREKAAAEKLAREQAVERREQAKKEMAAVTRPMPSAQSYDTLVPEIVIKAVCGHWRIVIEQLLVQDRRPHIVFMRDILMYLLYEDTDLSYPQVGDLLGGRDHTTIMHGVEKVAEEIARGESTSGLIDEIRAAYAAPIKALADPS